jgi:hypothetical protein
MSQAGIIVAVVVVCSVIVFLALRGAKCKCKNEGYTAPHNAKFTVNHPKYMVQPNYPVKSNEGYLPYSDGTQVTTLVSDVMTTGGFTPGKNPFLGPILNESKYGVSVPGTNTPTTTYGSGSSGKADDPATMNVWSTVI